MKKIMILWATLFSFILFTTASFADIQVDLQENYEWAKYNYTDLVETYNDQDGWVEFKFAYWFNEAKSLSPFLAIIPSSTSADKFWWQRNVEYQIGLQWYPFYRPEDHRFLKSIRLFAVYARKTYYDEEPGQDPQDEDVEYGLDYYYDNLFDPTMLTFVIYSKLAHIKTNYTTGIDYDMLTWALDLKVGPKFENGDALIFPYVLLESNVTAAHKTRWWENYVRTGLGLRFYPKAFDAAPGMWGDFLKRFNIYAEVVENIDWIRKEAPPSVDDNDYRIGLSFSTSGYYRDEDTLI